MLLLLLAGLVGPVGSAEDSERLPQQITPLVPDTQQEIEPLVPGGMQEVVAVDPQGIQEVSEPEVPSAAGRAASTVGKAVIVVMATGLSLASMAAMLMFL